ncbi:FKBP-type peptidyl-prolyl cis-trans isomerase [Chitinophaga pendula]|uniref:FKBP-type peptidyl-prolyl cis-trans isomerase n=1 Tax=Chitinophaga TaxID=79328 RepID=UPI000BAEA33D|nr:MULTISPECIES: FKBP-type peptidyl-prolyl cis-trans isomerase [Chitinophaga]ASZ14005.1 peptidylprolyl isomerase [Chitinophaga sp. MD30]UCJ08371.1 FKBP-type peptidyl-prolyl cis-trans isomerase [Chitinophaga pendula]
MKKLLFLGSLLLLLIAACKKSNNESFDPAAQMAADTVKIKAYLAKNNLTAQKDPSGLYYRIITPGTGTDTIKLESKLVVVYKGKYLDDDVEFDSSKDKPTDFGGNTRLKNLIRGWQIGLTKITKGGKIQLFIPSGLAYGNNPGNGLRNNACMIFEVELVDHAVN